MLAMDQTKKIMYEFKNLVQLSSINTSSSERTSGDEPLRLVAYAPYESGASTIEQMKVDLKLAKDIGFDGIKLWNIRDLLKDDNLPKILDIGEELGLKFNLPLMVGNPYDFPDDNESIAEFKTYLSKLTEIVKGRDNVLWYGLWYPIAWKRSVLWNQQNMARTKYQQTLQEFVDVLKENDPEHEVRLFADFDLTIYRLPKNFSNVDGYGVQPYSRIKDSIDGDRIKSYVSYFLDTGKPVYIDEWGLHTSNNWVSGTCTDEETKARVLTDFVSFVEGEGLTWTYFLLLDSRLYKIDWGIVNGNRTLRLSGQILNESFYH